MWKYPCIIFLHNVILSSSINNNGRSWPWEVFNFISKCKYDYPIMPGFTIVSDIFEDPFSYRQEESAEESLIENLLQRNRDLQFSPKDKQEGVFIRPSRSFITEEILEALRKADRKGRDVVVGLSNACCKWGCSKSEISSLCWDLCHLTEQTYLFTHKWTQKPNTPSPLPPLTESYRSFYIRHVLVSTWYKLLEMFTFFNLWSVWEWLSVV